MENCPLCQSGKSTLFCEDKRRKYLRCPECYLVFVPQEFILSQEKEKAIYDLHENDPFDQGYRKFLSRLADPLKTKLQPGAEGLDFGCGPGPALAEMLKEEGFKVNLYDLYYFPEKDVLNIQYDFVTSTELVEHVKDSKQLFQTFHSLLKDTGTLGLMTKLVIDEIAFSTWHYKNDQTHIRFFSKETFKWITEKWNFTVEFTGKDVIFLTKQ